MAASKFKEPATSAMKESKPASTKKAAALPTTSAAKPATKGATVRKKSAALPTTAEVNAANKVKQELAAKAQATSATKATAKSTLKQKTTTAKPSTKGKAANAATLSAAEKTPEPKTATTKAATIKALANDAAAVTGKETSNKPASATEGTKGKTRSEKKRATASETTSEEGTKTAPSATKQQPASVARPTVAEVVPDKQSSSVPVVEVINKPVKKKSSGAKEKAAKALLSKLPKEMFSARTGGSSADAFPPKELEKFRKNIEYKRDEQIKDLDIAKDLLEEVTSRDSADDNSAYSLHMEQGTDAMEREKRYLEVQRGSDYLKRLEEAMVRISNGTYGMCRKCGLRLDSRRLLEVPIAQVCPTYKNTNKLCEPGKLYKEALDQEE